MAEALPILCAVCAVVSTAASFTKVALVERDARLKAASLAATRLVDSEETPDAKAAAEALAANRPGLGLKLKSLNKSKENLQTLADGAAACGTALGLVNMAETLADEEGEVWAELITFFCQAGDWLQNLGLLSDGSSSSPPEPLSNDGSSRHFCVGAVLCQQQRATSGNLKMTSLPSQAIPTSCFICRHCGLIVGNAGVLRVKDGKVVVWNDFLPSSHLMANKSWDDLHAFYRCVLCHKKGAEVDFASASDLERHMQGTHWDDNFDLRAESGSSALDTVANELAAAIPESGQTAIVIEADGADKEGRHNEGRHNEGSLGHDLYPEMEDQSSQVAQTTYGSDMATASKPDAPRDTGVLPPPSEPLAPPPPVPDASSRRSSGATNSSRKRDMFKFGSKA